MIIGKNDKFVADGKTFFIGGRVFVNSANAYAGLVGRVTEIRTDADKETETKGPEIYCDFDVPESDAVVRKIEARFSKLYQMPKRIEDLPLGDVVMAPEMLEPVAETLTKPEHIGKLYTLSLLSGNNEDYSIEVLGVSMDRSILLRKMLNDVDHTYIPVTLSYSQKNEASTYYFFEPNEIDNMDVFMEYIISEVPVYPSEEGVCTV